MVSCASLGAILLFLSPTSGGPAVHLLFSVTLLLILGTLLGVGGIFLRRRFITSRSRTHVYAIALREGFILAAVALYALWLSRFDALNGVSAGAAVVIAILAEYYFLTHYRVRA